VRILTSVIINKSCVMNTMDYCIVHHALNFPADVKMDADVQIE
jgi:hypothetical protein